MAAPDGRAEYFNAQWFAYTGASYAEAADDGWLRAAHPDDLPRVVGLRSQTLQTGDLFETEFRLRRFDGEYRWFLVRSVAMRSPSGEILRWFGSCTDINAQKRAEELLLFFARAGSVLSESLEPRVLGRNFAKLLVPDFADYCQLFLIDGDEFALLADDYADAAQATVMHDLLARYPVTREDRLIAGVLASGQPRLIEEVLPEMRAERAQDAQHRVLLDRFDARSLICMPLTARGNLIGVFLSGYTRSGRRHSSSDVPVLHEMARRLALALDNARRYQNEHEVAAAFAKAMLPRELPRVEGVRLSRLYIPASTELRVGGDWFDAFALPSGLIGLSIGDVTGHGLDAAIVMGEMRQAIRSAAIESNAPSQVLDHADRVLAMNHPDAIATAGFGIYDPADRSLTYATAGHPPPLVARADGSVYEIIASGLPLGLRSAGTCDSTAVSLDGGSLVCFYTDGLTEFDRNAIEGEKSLHAALAAQALAPARDPAEAIYHAVVHDGSHHDDTAILVLQIE